MYVKTISYEIRRYLVVVVGLAALVADRADLSVVSLVVLHVVLVSFLQFKRLVAFLTDKHLLLVYPLVL